MVDSDGLFCNQEPGVIRHLLDALPAAICITDTAAHIGYANPAWLQLTGTAPGQFTGVDLATLFVDDSTRQAFRILLQACTRPGAKGTNVFAATLQCGDTRIQVAMTVRGLPDDRQGIGRLVFSFVNAEPTKRAETALREGWQRYQQLFEQMVSAFSLHTVICDPAGEPVDYRFLAVNPAFEKMTGMKADQLIGRTVKDVLPGIEDYWIKLFGNVALTGQPVTFSHYVAPLARHYEGTAFCPKHGQFVVCFTDITDRIRIQGERERMAQLDKLTTLGTLVTGVGHEINNPNNFIMLNAPLLMDVWKDIQPILDAHYLEQGDFSAGGLQYSEMRDEIPELIRSILDGAHRIRDIVTGLKDYARLGSTRFADCFSINEALRGALRLTGSLLQEHAEAVHRELAEDLPLIRGHRQRIEQVMVNILQNACLALPETGGAVQVRTFANPGTAAVCFQVKDTGCGMSPDVLARITEPFFSTRRSNGTGLGLSISKGIVEEHGGTLTFASTPGKGTTVTVTLPLTPPSVKPAGDNNPTRQPSAAAGDDSTPDG